MTTIDQGAREQIAELRKAVDTLFGKLDALAGALTDIRSASGARVA
jgi:hypothetical protein